MLECDVRRIKRSNICQTLVFVAFIILNFSCAGGQGEGSKHKQDSQRVNKDTSKIRVDSILARGAADTSYRLYLTFDDGPYTTTPGLSRFLQEKGVRASFFIVGSQVAHSAEYDSIYRTVASNPLFKVYNHTYSHAVTKGRIHKYYSRPDSVWGDILRNRHYLPKGVTITRLPGKNTWRIPDRRTTQDREVKLLLSLVDSLGPDEKIVGWDFEWVLKHSNDSLSMIELAQKIVSKFQAKGHPSRHIVLLSHDYLYRTSTSLSHLGAFIDFFKRKGNVRFEWVENLPSIASHQRSLEAGQ